MTFDVVSCQSHERFGNDGKKIIFIDHIPDNKIIKCNFDQLSKIARLQIEIHLNKILLHPKKKSLYIVELNKVILYNLGFKIKYEKDDKNE